MYEACAEAHVDAATVYQEQQQQQAGAGAAAVASMEATMALAAMVPARTIKFGGTARAKFDEGLQRYALEPEPGRFITNGWTNVSSSKVYAHMTKLWEQANKDDWDTSRIPMDCNPPGMVSRPAAAGDM